MDQEKFEQQLMGYLFDELDEVSAAAVKRHLDGSAEARELEARLRATIEATRVPHEQPSASLEARVLDAIANAEQGEPWHRKVLRALSWAGSHAMRPQFAMGALMVMLLGSSLLLLRARPGAMQVSTARNAETPSDASPTNGSSAPPPIAAPAQAPAAAPAAAALDEAKRDDESPKGLLERARKARADLGCKEALPLYARLRERSGSSGFGADATFEEATCELEQSNRQRAEELASRLKDHPEYRRKVASLLATKVARKAEKLKTSRKDAGGGADARRSQAKGVAASPRASSAPAAGAAAKPRE
ncbi:MAG: hypothetical protein FJ095_12840 [Deltaproteobacteria bacterium]|nr:hypothetical protein [Deltaproteobacteria bacterium]